MAYPADSVADASAEFSQITQFLFDKETTLHSSFEAHELIESGLPESSLTVLIRHVDILHDQQNLKKALGISLRTLQRRKEKADSSAQPRTLTLDQSNRTWKFAETLSKAIEVLGTQRAAEQWLVTPAMALNRRCPLDLMSTQAGSELVDDLLIRMEYGVYT